VNGLPLWELVLRLLLAVVLCGLVGLERESRGQAAGLRTHVVVGLGSALFTVVSAYGFADAGVSDPTRIAAQIVSGIGFLGAGAILRTGGSVRGLTTAGTLWVVAALGMAAGAGAYAAAIAATLVLVPAIVVLRSLRGPLSRRLRHGAVSLDVTLDAERFEDVAALVDARGARIRSMSSEIAGSEQSASLELRVPPAFDVQALMRAVAALDGVRRVAATETRPTIGGLDE
jgi:putative Mg2+ transporter-C (MgtC) family protein